MLTAGAVMAALETQTFPVTVSNAVLGKLETVPVTFRIGETNGAVERFDGQRFVPVPVRGELAFPYTERLEHAEKGADGRPELILTDTYRDIVRRYRSGGGTDGKRWERFEIVK